jgi:hypothetical protein
MVRMDAAICGWIFYPQMKADYRRLFFKKSVSSVQSVDKNLCIICVHLHPHWCARTGAAICGRVFTSDPHRRGSAPAPAWKTASPGWPAPLASATFSRLKPSSLQICARYHSSFPNVF